MIFTSERALRASSRHLDEQSQRIEESASELLLFYAAECVCKAQVLRDRGVRSWEDIEEEERKRLGHHLDRLAQELRLAQTIEHGLRPCRMRGSSSPDVRAFETHQVWRYGGRLDVADNRRFVDALRALVDAVTRYGSN